MASCFGRLPRIRACHCCRRRARHIPIRTHAATARVRFDILEIAIFHTTDHGRLVLRMAM